MTGKQVQSYQIIMPVTGQIFGNDSYINVTPLARRTFGLRSVKVRALNSQTIILQGSDKLLCFL